MPYILKGFDRAMRIFLVENCGPQQSQLLTHKIRGTVYTGGGIEVTGKQALKHLLVAFGKSPDQIIREAHEAFASFTVPEGADSYAWENAFALFDMRIAMAAGKNAGNKEHNASLVLARLVDQLNNSPHNTLSGLKEKLEDEIRTNKANGNNVVRTRQDELAWYKH